jgi:branched-chain amino acid transport system ATP-binding protein
MKVNKRQYLGLQARRTATFNYLGTAHSRVQEKPEIRPTRDTAAGHEALLRLINVAAGYGQARVLHNVNLDIRPGGAIAIFGTNGAGKTTLANAITGSVSLTGGEIIFSGVDLTKLPLIPG